MKKFILLSMAAVLAVAMCACGSQKDTLSDTGNDTAVEQQEEEEPDEEVDESKSDQTTHDEAEEETVTSEKDFDGSGYSDTGVGSFSVKTAAGSTADGIIPVLYANPGGMVQIGATGEEMDGSLLTHIYIDGVENQTIQIGYRTDFNLSLQGDALAAGQHTVEAVQFEGNDTSAAVTMYKSARYEVQPKQ